MAEVEVRAQMKTDRPAALRRTPLKNKGMKPIPLALRRAVRKRDDDCCRICFIDLSPNRGHIHHRLKRSLGGQNTLANLLLLCARHHAMLDEKAWIDLAYQLGFYLRTHQDPETTPVENWPVAA